MTGEPVRSIHDFEIVRTLGRGSQGDALLCKRKKDGELFCVKEVKIGGLKPRERTEALREVAVLSKLEGPNIIRYYGSWEENGNLYIQMEYATGGDLAQLVRGRNGKLFEEEEVLTIFVGCCLGLATLHRAKVCHRDMKLENVFLMAGEKITSDLVRLGDFGVARFLERTTQLCRTQVGTPLTMSPECVMGKPYGMKTDVWGLGAMLYELASLKRAFDGRSLNQLVVQIVRGSYKPIPPPYSTGLQDLVARMLAKSDAARPTVQEILDLPFIRRRLAGAPPELDLAPSSVRRSSALFAAGASSAQVAGTLLGSGLVAVADAMAVSVSGASVSDLSRATERRDEAGKAPSTAPAMGDSSPAAAATPLAVLHRPAAEPASPVEAPHARPQRASAGRARAASAGPIDMDALIAEEERAIREARRNVRRNAPRSVAKDLESLIQQEEAAAAERAARLGGAPDVTAEPSPTLFVADSRLVLPPVNDSESRLHRAEAIRHVLENAIGLTKLLQALEVARVAGDVQAACEGCPPGTATMILHLVELEE